MNVSSIHLWKQITPRPLPLWTDRVLTLPSVAALAPRVGLLGGEALGQRLGLDEVRRAEPQGGVSTLVKGHRRARSPSRCHGRPQREAAVYKPGRESSHQVPSMAAS